MSNQRRSSPLNNFESESMQMHTRKGQKANDASFCTTQRRTL